MTKKAFAVLFSIFALCFALVGCGSQQASTTVNKDDFVGVYQANSMRSDGEEMGEEEFDECAEIGLYVYLTLDENGDAELDVFGTTAEGEWGVSDDGKVVISFDDEDFDATLKDDILTITDDEDYIAFKRIDADDMVEMGDSSEVTLEDVESIEEMDLVIADDDQFTITITGKGTDSLGDPSYWVTVENKTDKTVSAGSSYGSFSVNGKMCDPIFYADIQPGKYAETTMWWSTDDIASVDELVSVEGTIEICDEGYNVLASYPVSID